MNSDKLRNIAELASKRKLTRKQRNAYILLFRQAANFLQDATEIKSESALRLAKRVIYTCEMGLLAEEEGEGENINFSKLLDTNKIDLEKVSFWEKYWKEIIIAISTAIATTLINKLF